MLTKLAWFWADVIKIVAIQFNALFEKMSLLDMLTTFEQNNSKKHRHYSYSVPLFSMQLLYANKHGIHNQTPVRAKLAFLNVCVYNALIGQLAIQCNQYPSNIWRIGFEQLMYKPFRANDCDNVAVIFRTIWFDNYSHRNFTTSFMNRVLILTMVECPILYTVPCDNYHGCKFIFHAWK